MTILTGFMLEVSQPNCEVLSAVRDDLPHVRLSQLWI